MAPRGDSMQAGPAAYLMGPVHVWCWAGDTGGGSKVAESGDSVGDESLEKVPSDGRRGDCVDAADIKELLDEKWHGRPLHASSELTVPDIDESRVPQWVELSAERTSSLHASVRPVVADFDECLVLGRLEADWNSSQR